MREQAQLGHEVGERLVDHDKTAPRGEAMGELAQRLGTNDAAVGIVGVGEHHDRGVGGQLFERRDFRDRAACRPPRFGVALIGRRENRDPPRRRDEGEQPERDFAARAGDEIGSTRDAIGSSRRVGQSREAIPRREPRKRRRVDRGSRVGAGIDPGGEVEPPLHRRTVVERRKGEVAAMAGRPAARGIDHATSQWLEVGPLVIPSGSL